MPVHYYMLVTSITLPGRAITSGRSLKWPGPGPGRNYIPVTLHHDGAFEVASRWELGAGRRPALRPAEALAGCGWFNGQPVSASARTASAGPGATTVVPAQPGSHTAVHLHHIPHGEAHH